MLTTGQIFLIVGICSLVTTIIGAISGMVWLERKEREVRSEIWNEYQ